MEYHLTGQTLKTFEDMAPEPVISRPEALELGQVIQLWTTKGNKAVRVSWIGSHPKIGLLLELQPY